jgi:hypothetical protein
LATSSRLLSVVKLSIGHLPSMADAQEAMAFVVAQTAHYKAIPTKLEHVNGSVEKTDAAPELLGLTALCNALMSSNEFHYLD